MLYLNIKEIARYMQVDTGYMRVVLARAEFDKHIVPYSSPRQYTITPQFVEDLYSILEPRSHNSTCPQGVKQCISNYFECFTSSEHYEVESEDITILDEFCNDPRCIIDFNLVFPLWKQPSYKMQFKGVIRRDICKAVKRVLQKYKGVDTSF